MRQNILILRKILTEPGCILRLWKGISFKLNNKRTSNLQMLIKYTTELECKLFGWIGSFLKCGNSIWRSSHLLPSLLGILTMRVENEPNLPLCDANRGKTRKSNSVLWIQASREKKERFFFWADIFFCLCPRSYVWGVRLTFV